MFFLSNRSRSCGTGFTYNKLDSSYLFVYHPLKASWNHVDYV
nr:MAG TPA: hypothetical protein [Caudoviricetes sp.]